MSNTLPNYEEIQAATKVILWILGVVASVGGAVAIVAKIMAPYRKLKDEVEAHRVALERDHARLTNIDECNKLQLKALMNIVNHELTGNSIDKLKDVRDEINDYLLDK